MSGAASELSGRERAGAFNFESAAVAIIDSNALCMELLTNILRGAGFRTNHRCVDLASGTDIVKSHAIDLLLVDPFQYGQGAYDLVRWLRSERRGRSAAASVLMVSAHTSVRMISAARQCGADYVVAKPFSITTLLDRILWVASQEDRRGELVAPRDVVTTSGSGVELW